MTEVCLALPNLFDNVSERFKAEGTDAQNVFGWRKPSKHRDGNRRIVWVPGDETGSLGDIQAPRGPGNNPRPLANLFELFTVHIESFDPRNAENELTQYRAARLLYDAWYRAVYLAAHGTFSILSNEWNITKNERRHGATIVVVGTVQAVIPDEVFDVVPAETRAVIQTSLLDVTEETVSSDPP